MRFYEYINEGRSRGEDMEEAIIASGNNEEFPVGLRITQEAGQNVANFLKTQGLTGKGKVIGAENIDVTRQGASYFPGGKVPAKTKTPKTDFIIGSDKISLKTGDSAQLMSGGKSESEATFYTALSKTEKTQENLIKELEDSLESFALSSVASGKVSQQLKKAEDKVLLEADKAHKKIQKQLSNLFDVNQQFRREFTYEAMTGETKFGGNLGTCTHFLVTSWDGTSNHYKDCSNNAYIEKIASRMKTSVRFKTSPVKKTGEYRYGSVVGLIIDKLNEEISSYNVKTLNEGMLRDVVTKIKNWFKKVIRSIMNFLRKNTKNLIDFLQLDPEISVKTNIDFS